MHINISDNAHIEEGIKWALVARETDVSKCRHRAAYRVCASGIEVGA